MAPSVLANLPLCCMFLALLACSHVSALHQPTHDVVVVRSLLQSDLTRLGPVGGEKVDTDVAFKGVCPQHSFVVLIHGRGNDFIDGIAATCSDGTKLGPYGGDGGYEYNSVESPMGFQEVRISWSTLYAFVVLLKFFPTDKSLAALTYGGVSDENAKSLLCGAQSVIVGFVGSRTAEYRWDDQDNRTLPYVIRSVGVYCRPMLDELERQKACQVHTTCGECLASKDDCRWCADGNNCDGNGVSCGVLVKTVGNCPSTTNSTTPEVSPSMNQSSWPPSPSPPSDITVPGLAAPPKSQESSKSNSLSVGQMVAIVAPVAVVMSAIITMLYTAWKWWHKKKLVAAKQAPKQETTTTRQFYHV